jgi:VanZ family protein
MNEPDRRTRSNIALAAILVILLALTLAPSSSGTIDYRNLCLICGERGLADAVLNVILFLPLGLALGVRFRSKALAYALAIFVSAGIEITQVFIPGRDSSLADVLFNGMGSVLGVGLARSWRLWLLPSAGAGRRLAVAAAGLALLTFAGTDFLLRPDYPEMAYDAVWTPRLGYVPQYEGVVLGFTLGGVPLPNGFIADSRAVRDMLAAGAPLRVTAIAGAPPDGRAPLVEVDGFQRSIVSLAVDRHDLSYRYRMRSDAFRLDRPELRLRDALRGVRPGETFAVGVESEGDAYCLSVEPVRRCGLGFTLGQGWSLLLWSGSFPAWLSALLGLMWMMALGLPVGYWAPTRREALWLMATIAVAAVLIPGRGPLLATPWHQMAALVAGFALGSALRRSQALARDD